MGDVVRVRIGNQTARSAGALMEPFDYAVSHQFDAFEWFPDQGPDGQGWTERALSPGARAEIRRTARDHDIALSVHGSWHANPLTADGLDCLGAQAKFAAEIGARVFVTHLVATDGPSLFLEAVRPLVACLTHHRMVLAVENTPEVAAREVNDLFRHVHRLGLEHRVGLCLDVGHANLCPDTRNDYLRWEDELAADVAIAHLHLHENRGDQDSHLTVFTGPAADDPSGIETLLRRLVRRRFAGCIILEQWPRPPALLDAARARLGRIIAATEVSR